MGRGGRRGLPAWKCEGKVTGGGEEGCVKKRKGGKGADRDGGGMEA